MLKKIFLITSLLISATSCASPQKQHNKNYDSLLKYTYSNCIFWYFKKKNYDLDDIRSISGGFVEKSSASLEKFEEIALFMKDYKPDIKSKNKIDIDLNKCFFLENSKELMQIIKK